MMSRSSCTTVSTISWVRPLPADDDRRLDPCTVPVWFGVREPVIGRCAWVTAGV
jgi:hypothetical protein